MIWKDYLKLSEIVSYSKLARASKNPPDGIGLSINSILLTLQRPRGVKWTPL